VGTSRIRNISLALALLLLASEAEAAVSFNAATAATITFSGVSSISQSYTLAAGTGNNCAVARVMWISSTVTITAISYGGSAMTSAGAAAQDASGANVQLFTLVNPSSGSNTLAITFSGTVQGVVDVGSFSGVDQSTPVRVGTYTTFVGTTDAGSGNYAVAITSDINDLTVSVATNHNSNLNSTTQTVENIDNSFNDTFGSDHATTAAASVTHTWNDSTSQNAAIAGFSLQGAGATSSTPMTPTRTLLGVGQ